MPWKRYVVSSTGDKTPEQGVPSRETDMPTVNVSINGKNYRMACDEGQEEHLENLGQKFDQYVNHLKGSFGDIGDQRLVVMAGVMVTDEMLELKKTVSKLENQMEDLQSNSALRSREKKDGDDELAENLNSLAGKIEALGAKLKGEAS